MITAFEEIQSAIKQMEINGTRRTAPGRYRLLKDRLATLTASPITPVARIEVGVCTCAFKLTRAGKRFYGRRNPACPTHGDDKLDWRAFLQMSGRDLAGDEIKLDCGDVEGRFGGTP